VQSLSCEAYIYPLCWYGLLLFLCTYPFFNLVFIDMGRKADGGIRSLNQHQQSVMHDVIHHVLEHVLAMSFRFQLFLAPGKPGILKSV
jgi:hypothetical protein